MPDREFTYRVTVDSRSAATGAAQARRVIERELGRIQIAPQINARGGASPLPAVATRAGGVGTLMGGAGGLAGLSIGGFAVTEMARAALEAGRLGAENLRLARSYDQLAVGAGLAGDVLLQKLSKATQQTVSEQQLMASTNMLLAAAQEGQIRITEEQIATLAQFARLRSTQLTANGRPMTTEEAYGRLIQGTIKRETELLDELGLSTKAIADTLGVPLNQINKDVESLLGAIVKVADIEIERFGEPILDEATRIEQAATRIEESTNRIRAALAGPAAWTFERGANLAEGIDSILTGLFQGQGNERLGNFQTLLQRRMEQATTNTPGDQVTNWSAAHMAITEFNRAIAAGAPGMEQHRDQLLALADAALANIDPHSDLAEQLEGLIRIFVEASNEASANADANSDSGAAAAEAAAELAELAAETREAAGELGYLVDIAYSAGAGLDDLGDKADDLADKLANVRAQNAGLVQLEQTLGRGILSAGQDLSTVVGPTQAESMIRGALGELEMARESWRQQGITDPVQIALLERTLTERLITPMTNIVDEHEAATREADRLQKQAARETEAAFEAAANATEDAFREAASELESKIRSIPGVIGASDVTKGQMDLAALGLPQNFADDIRRRLEDEVLNKVDWPDIDPASLFARAGIDPALDPKAQMALFNQKWADSSLFADPANLGLFNQDAIRAELERQKMSELGQQNILSMFGLTEGEDGTMFADLGGVMAGGMKAGAEEGLAEFGRDAIANVMVQLKSETAITEYGNTGRVIGDALFAGVIDGATGSDLVGAIVAEVLRQINDELPPAP